MSNRLINETSPYLLQHAENPVDWYPWCDEAFRQAKNEDKPIFLSIGYSTCHWCHVMAHESFEDPATAEILNNYFICIKVDREERPDIDSVYMAVCQAFTGSGGWPTSIFLTPEAMPFFAGTYFPLSSAGGGISFKELLLLIHEKWRDGRDELLHSSEKVIGHLKSANARSPGTDESIIEKAADYFKAAYDKKYGGFGSAPKFPCPHNLLFLLAYSQVHKDEACLDMVKTTLKQMRKGGIFDQIGFGFSRYSTDRMFLAPHFEKMLYDNALLVIAYSTAYVVCGEAVFLDTAEKTASYILREMTNGSGGFYSAQDADSEGVEGKYYLFDYDEIIELLGAETGRLFNSYYGITKEGNFEGQNIPNRLHSEKSPGNFDECLPKIYEYRQKRAKLHLDDKVLTSWNSLMIWAFSLLYRVTDNQKYLEAAEKAEKFISDNLYRNGTLYVSSRNGKLGGTGFLDDYAFYSAALISLYEAAGNKAYLLKSETVCRECATQFADTENGGFYLSGAKNQRLILSPKETYDGAIPSGNSVMAFSLVRLSQLTHSPEWETAAANQLDFLLPEAGAYPAGQCMFLLALLVHAAPPPSITVVMSEGDQWGKIKKQLPFYADITLLNSETDDYKLLNGKTTYYVCRGKTCLPPQNEI